MGGTLSQSRRVFIEDSRGTGGFFRATWHPQGRTVVMSSWEGNACVGATRVRVEDTGELIAMLARALAEAAVSDAAAVERGPSAGRSVAWRPKMLLARVRRLVGGGASEIAGTAAGPAPDGGGEARWLADHPRRAV